MAVELIARPHPLRSELYRATALPGTTLAQLLGEDVDPCVHAQVNGELWPRERWGDPLPEGVVNLYATPQGDVGRLLGMIVVAVIAAYTGGLAAGALGLAKGTLGYAAVSAGVTAAVTVAGSALVNALIPPQMPSTSGASGTTIAHSITGVRNQTNPYGVIPRVHGNPRWFPPLAAMPVTEIAGNDQYLRMLLCLGYGPLQVGGQTVGEGYPLLTSATGLPVGTLRVGETDIGQYADVEWEIGMADQLTLFTQDIFEDSVAAALDLQDPDTREVEHFDNFSVVRTTAPGTREISLDLVFNGLFALTGKGSARDVEVRFVIEYAPTGTGSWERVPGNSTPRMIERAVRPSGPPVEGQPPIEYEWVQADPDERPGDYHAFGGHYRETLRRNIRWAVPAGQYDVRVTRWSTWNAHRETVVSNAIWSVLRSIRGEQRPYAGRHVLLALRIRATDQLNGVIDQLNIRTQSVLRVWSEAGFYTLAPTSNPAWAYLDALTGPQVGRPIDDLRINLDSIVDFAQWCEAQGLEYHWVHDAPETLLERARSILAAGQGSFALQDGLFGVVRDDPDAPLVQTISPRNASGFESRRQYRSLPHALRVKYIDPATWTDAERIVYRDGYDETNATLFEDLQTKGVASADEAWHHGQFHFRQAILRPETYQVGMDWEHLALMRGNRARLAYDTLMVGLGWGRVKSVVANGAGAATAITLDERVTLEAGTTYGVRIRRQDGTQATVAVSAAVGETDTLALAEPVSGVHVGDLVLYGEHGKESIDCKVIRIEPGPDLTATVTLVDSALNIYDYDEPPEYDPHITRPRSQERPPAPTGLTVISGSDVYTQMPDGTILSAARVTWHPAPDVQAQQWDIEYRTQADNTWTSAQTIRPRAQIAPVYDGDQLEVRVRVRTVYGVSEWATATHTVSALPSGVPPEDGIRPVPNVTGLELFGQGNDTDFSGRDAKFAWRATSVSEWYALGYEPVEEGAGTGGLDLWFRDYQVRIYDVETGELRRTEHVADPGYVYTWEKNAEDSQRLGLPGPRRQIRVEVVIRGRQGQVSARPATLTVQNPPPELPAGWNLRTSFFAAAAEFLAPADTDFSRVSIYLSTSQGFEPGPDTLAWQGSDSPAMLHPLEADTTYYYRYRAEDAFGPGAISGELAFTTKELAATDISGLGPWAQIPDGDRAQIEAWLAGAPGPLGPPLYQPRIVAGQIVSGVLQATTLIDSEGLIRVRSGDYHMVMGPHIRWGELFTLSAHDVDADVLYTGIRANGRFFARGADIEGTVVISGPTSTILGRPASAVAAGLDNDGNVSRVISSANLAGGSAKPGLNLTGTHLGFWSGSAWSNYFTASGDAVIGSLASGNYVEWDQVSGRLTVQGDLRRGKASYTDTASGWWLGNHGGVPVLHIGNATSWLKWTGAALQVRGDVEATSIKAGSVIVDTGHITPGAVSGVSSTYAANHTVDHYVTLDDAVPVFVLGTLVQSWISFITLKRINTVTLQEVPLWVERPDGGTLATRGYVDNPGPGTWRYVLTCDETRNTNGTSITTIVLKR